MKKRKKLHRVAALMAALVLVVACMVPAPYYAADVNIQTFLSACGLPRLPEYNPSYKYHFFDNPQDGYECVRVAVFEKGVDYVFYGLSSYSKAPYGVVQDSKVATYSIYDIDLENGATEWEKTVSSYEADGPIGASSGQALSSWRAYYSDFVLYTDYKTLNDVYYEAGHYYTHDYGLTDVIEIPSEQYNSELGYVQDVSVKYLTIVGDLTGTQSRYKFSFSSSSTSGVDLSSGDYVIRLYEQATIYQISAVSNNMLNLDMPKILIGEYDASTGTFDFNISEALKATDAETGDIPGFNIFTSTLLGYVRSDSFWLQIYNKTTGEYGGFVKLERSPSVDKSAFSSCTYLGSEDDISKHGEKDNLGYIDNKVDGSTGSGTNFDDAELNADKTTSSGSDSVLDQFYDLISLVSAVPKLFAALFGFLPEWCLNIVAISIAVGSSLIIWKVARG